MANFNIAGDSLLLKALLPVDKIKISNELPGFHRLLSEYNDLNSVVSSDTPRKTLFNKWTSSAKSSGEEFFAGELFAKVTKVDVFYFLVLKKQPSFIFSHSENGTISGLQKGNSFLELLH